jgi:hypothetical protein
MPPSPPCDIEPSLSSEMDSQPPGYLYIRTPLCIAHCINHAAYTKDQTNKPKLMADLVTDEGSSTS